MPRHDRGQAGVPDHPDRRFSLVWQRRGQTPPHAWRDLRGGHAAGARGVGVRGRRRTAAPDDPGRHARHRFARKHQRAARGARLAALLRARFDAVLVRARAHGVARRAAGEGHVLQRRELLAQQGRVRGVRRAVVRGVDRRVDRLYDAPARARRRRLYGGDPDARAHHRDDDALLLVLRDLSRLLRRAGEAGRRNAGIGLGFGPLSGAFNATQHVRKRKNGAFWAPFSFRTLIGVRLPA
ncbi:hypothetical protein PUN4_1000043 [Paraburkholderia unamae]|nr:hypothetical protein PUN4_1000043 [Paraburkholderia unamae]